MPSRPSSRHPPSNPSQLVLDDNESQNATSLITSLYFSWFQKLTFVRIRVSHSLNFLLGFVQESSDRARVADMSVAFELNSNLDRFVAPQVSTDVPVRMSVRTLARRSREGLDGVGSGGDRRAYQSCAPLRARRYRCCGRSWIMLSVVLPCAFWMFRCRLRRGINSRRRSACGPKTTRITISTSISRHESTPL